MTRPAGRPGGQRFARLSIRNKLLVLVLLPLVVVLPLLGLALLLWGSVAFDRLLVTKVSADLAVANGYFERVLGEVDASTAAVADAHGLHQALARHGEVAAGAIEEPELRALLASYRDRERLDFVTLRGADGRVRASSNGPLPEDDGLAAHAQAGGVLGRTSVQVLAPAQQAALSAAQRERVPVPLLPTRNAAATTRAVEDRAMVVLSSRPIVAADGRLLGHVQGALLLNRNLAFIDHINAIVYPEGSLPFGSQGTATLFLDDVRISTNVRLFSGSGGNSQERAIGTRVSQTVRDTVLGQRRTWLDRAFVVNDWYVSAYQPLMDGEGRAVGMLYVGYLERPFRLLKYAVLASIGVIFLPVMLGAAAISLRWARSIFKPLERMEATMQRVQAGDGTARVGAVALPGSEDEIGRLAGHLDELLGVIDDKTRSLQRWNAELDAKVAERTQQLAQAQSQLVRNEKLAAVGQLTASIAHEVNNPIAVIQGNLDLMRELLGPERAALVKAELRLVDEQIERMRLIVTQLLQFARPTEFAGYVEAVDTARVLQDCLVLVNHLLARTRIEVQLDLQAVHTVGINRQELQQVLVNLLVNAIHAMPDGGALRLATRDFGGRAAGAGVDVGVGADAHAGTDPGVEISVSDTGNGLAPELLATLFEPFVTGRKDGTGLGLWISRNLVERYGGEIGGANRDDGVRGAVFRVRLRSEARPPEG